MPVVPSFDAIVIGGGICGTSIAFELAADRSVALLEQESQLAYHSTGRSAASFVETIGDAPVRALSGASRAFLQRPPADFAPDPLAITRPVLYFSANGDADSLAAFRTEFGAELDGLRTIAGPEVREICPILRPAVAEHALLETTALGIDVHGLHQGFVRGLRARGATIISSTRLVSAERVSGGWTITDQTGQQYRASVLVNAGGAWSDRVASAAGARPLGIQPYRRTIFSVAPPTGIDPLALPMLIEIDELFYVKPEPGQLLCSPADETPQDAGDARPDELEIARALDLINELTTIGTRHVTTTWGGLRSFAPDRLPVVGFDPVVEGFFWYSGQGGYGVQTSPALSRTGAAIVRGDPVPADLAARGLTASQLSPGRAALHGPR